MPDETKRQISRYEHLQLKLSALQQSINLKTSIVHKVSMVGEFLVIHLSGVPSNPEDFANQMCLIADHDIGGDWTLLKHTDSEIILRRGVKPV